METFLVSGTVTIKTIGVQVAKARGRRDPARAAGHTGAPPQDPRGISARHSSFCAENVL